MINMRSLYASSVGQEGLLMQRKTDQQALWNHPYCTLSFVNVLSNLGFSIVLTTMTTYTLSMGATLSLAGTIASLFSFAAMLVRPFGGYLFDRISKKTVYILSTMLMGLTVLGYSFAGSLPVLMVIRVVHGALFGVSTTAAMALVTRFIPRERTSEGLGYFNAGTLVGQAVGPVIGSALIASISFRTMYTLIALSMALPPLFFCLVRLPEDGTVQAPKEPFRLSRLIETRFLVFAIVGGMFSYYNGTTNSFVLSIGQERGIQNISLFFTVASVSLIVIRIVVGRAADRASLKVMVLSSLCITMLSMLLLAQAWTLPMCLAAALLKSIGQGMGHVTLQGEAMKRADAARTGVVASTMLLGSDIGNTLGPTVSGIIAQHSSYAAVCYSGMLLTGLMALLFYWHVRRNP